MKVRINRLNPLAKMPHYAHPEDAGLDLYAVEAAEIPPGEARLIKTGISLELPSGTEAQVRPRSGLALKHSITVLNTPGTIDAGYRGEVGVLLINHGRHLFQITMGMKIAQLVIAPLIQAELEEVAELTDLTDSARGAGGFGSTGLG